MPSQRQRQQSVVIVATLCACLCEYRQLPRIDTEHTYTHTHVYYIWHCQQSPAHTHRHDVKVRVLVCSKIAHAARKCSQTRAANGGGVLCPTVLENQSDGIEMCVSGVWCCTTGCDAATAQPANGTNNSGGIT